MSEALVRRALRSHVLGAIDGALVALDELWVPRSNERADLAVVGHRLDGFEIKTDRDTLSRLPRQAEGYGRLFDRCTAVVAEQHLSGAQELLPVWWGISVIHGERDAIAFNEVRIAQANPTPDPEFLVRLLWRDEAMSAAQALGATPLPKATRGSLWRELLCVASLADLQAAVRHALLARDHGKAKLSSSRVITVSALAPGR